MLYRVTDLGDWPIVPLIGIAVLLYELRRAPSRYLLPFLLAVFVGDKLVTNGIKDLVDRARPTLNPIAETLGPSFPSGHSSTAASFYAALALILARRRGARVRALLAGAAGGIAVAVASSRVLLDVHWLSDVVAGVLARLGLVRALRRRVRRPPAAVRRADGAAVEEASRPATPASPPPPGRQGVVHGQSWGSPPHECQRRRTQQPPKPSPRRRSSRGSPAPGTPPAASSTPSSACSPSALANGVADQKPNQQGAMQQIAEQRFGHALLLLTAIGLGGYSLWRLAQALVGHTPEYGEHSTLDRIGAAGSCVAYARVRACSPISVLRGTGGNSSAHPEEDDRGRASAGPPGASSSRRPACSSSASALYQAYLGLSKKFLDVLEDRPDVPNVLTGVHGDRRRRPRRARDRVRPDRALRPQGRARLHAAATPSASTARSPGSRGTPTARPR